jgi:hypothetical protein
MFIAEVLKIYNISGWLERLDKTHPRQNYTSPSPFNN